MRAASWTRLVGVLLLVLVPARARAVTVRRFFEPTDLEIEDPWSVELDTQWGLVRGQDAFRVSVPDFELDLGLFDGLELDLDGEIAVGGPDTGEFRFDQAAQDNLWTAVKYQLWPAVGDKDGMALGVQVGPIVPIAPGAQGVGVEGLLLFELQPVGSVKLVFNAGGFTEPGDASGLPKDKPRPAETASDRRATGIASGVDIEIPISGDSSWLFLGEVSGVAYVSNDPPETATSAGLQWTPRRSCIDYALTAFRGWREGGDQYGVLLGASFHWGLDAAHGCASGGA